MPRVGRCPWLALKAPGEGWMKGLPAGVLGHTTQQWNNRWLTPPRSSARGGGRRVKGRGWALVCWCGGQVLDPAVCGHGFSMVANKANLFIGIQRCKLLFIKVSHLASREQNVNASSLAGAVSNTPHLSSFSARDSQFSDTMQGERRHPFLHTGHVHPRLYSYSRPSGPGFLFFWLFFFFFFLILHPTGRLAISPASN